MITPSQKFYRGIAAEPEKVPSGLDRLVHSLIGKWKRRRTVFRSLEKEADQVIRCFEEEITQLSEADFHEQIATIHAQLLRRRAGRKTAVRGLACVMRASQDILGMTPYRVQIIGALAIDRGLFAEMATGEGKTLTIGLAGILAGWRGRPCHIITSNDYLAQRDAESLADFYHYCGIEVGYITGEMTPEQRPEQYQKPVVYTTSQQLLADYLKDRISLGDDQAPESQLIRHLSSGDQSRTLTMRGIHTVIVDEADNILIDEAVTPLIISQVMKAESLGRSCRLARNMTHHLTSGKDYKINFKHSEVTLSNTGKNKITRHSHCLPPAWRSIDRSRELVRQALVAEHLFELDKNYVISDNKVEIVDESTGRIMPGRTWKQGLQQAIEAKEEIPISDPTETLASMSFQRFFRSFHKTSGVSGTAWESRGELWQVYQLPVFQIPCHRPVQRLIEPTMVFPTIEEKYAAVVEEAKAVSAAGRPVLVGTRSVEASERLSELLHEAGLEHAVLNAVRHEEEAAIISEAGKAATITIATNMAGRGTDIKVSDGPKSKGGLHVIVAECNLSPRIDRQLVGRSARQGEPGSARCYLCPADEIFLRFLKPIDRKRLINTARHKPSTRLSEHLKAKAQLSAGKLGASQRASMLKMDTWMDEHLSFTRTEAR